MNYEINNIEIENKEYQILIGKTAYGNEEIIKIGKEANKDNIWFHFDGISGPHIILCSNGDNIPKRYIIQVAKILFEYKSKAPKNTSVIYTEIKNVSLTNVLGTVIPRNIKIIKF